MQGKDLESKGNVLVAFMDWDGYTLGNAAVISEALTKSSNFVSNWVKRFEAEVSKDNGEEITRNLPHVSEELLKDLDENGVVRIGTRVKAGDILIGRIVTKSEVKLSSAERLWYSIFNLLDLEVRKVEDISIRMPFQDEGIVIDAKYLSSENGKQSAEVDILIKRELRVGDVLEDNEGNKIVVAKILPEVKMPYSRLFDIFDKRIEMIVNPALIKPGAELRLLTIGGRKRRKRVKVGEEIRVKKLPLLFEEKIHARATGQYFSLTCQPLNNKGGWIQGAKITKPEIRWLKNVGATNILQELLTFKSDGTSKTSMDVYEALVEAKELPAPAPEIPEVFKALVKVLQGLGISVEISEASLKLEFAEKEQILSWSYGKVSKAETINYETGKQIKDGLFCQRIFGPVEDFECKCGKFSGIKYKEVICDKCGVEVTKSSVRRERMGHIELVSPVSHPWCPEIILEVIPVIPPDLRPVVRLEENRIIAISEVTKLYQRIINRNNRLRKLKEMGAPEIILQRDEIMLRESVHKLFFQQEEGLHNLVYLAKYLSRAIWHKRVDYSGEGIIIPDPELQLDQCGLPKMMALEMFKPLVMGKLIKEGLAPRIKDAKRMIDRKAPESWEMLEKIVADYLILVGYSQDSNSSRIYAFHPILVEGEVLKLHPEVCKTLGAKLDGDQAAVYVPLSSKAQEEAKSLLFSISSEKVPETPEPLEAALFFEGNILEFLSKIGKEGKTLPLTSLDRLILPVPREM